MGQLSHCLEGGQIGEPDSPQPHQFNHIIRAERETEIQGGNRIEGDADIKSKYSTMVRKLQQYDKNTLTKMLIDSHQMRNSLRNYQALIKESRIFSYPPQKEGRSRQKMKEIKKLQVLKEECLRISRLRDEIKRKSTAREESQMDNKVHLHQSIFISIDQLEQQIQKATQKQQLQ